LEAHKNAETLEFAQPLLSSNNYHVSFFKESFPGYDPPLYTAPEVQALPPWADADILE